jgi:hypothetical protein
MDEAYAALGKALMPLVILWGSSYTATNDFFLGYRLPA